MSVLTNPYSGDSVATLVDNLNSNTVSTPRYRRRDPMQNGSNMSAAFSDSRNPITQLILTSPAYKQAYSIFSSDSQYGNRFLNQLEAIPYSYAEPNETWLDDMGFTSNYEDGIRNSYNDAMEQIQQLVQNYYEFRNSLPVEQVQQFADAGINSAVTGQGIDGSVGGNPVANDGTDLTSAQPAQVISEGVSSFVNFLTAIGNLGIASGNLDVARQGVTIQQEQHDIQLAKEGVTTGGRYRVLSADNSPVLADSAEIQAKTIAATKQAYDSQITFNNRMYDGYNVMTEISKFALINKMGQDFYDNVMAQRNAKYADLLTTLDLDYRASSMHAGISQNDFNTEYYRARNGQVEGANETSISTYIKDIKNLEKEALAFTDWINDFKQGFMSDWGERIEKEPHLSPFFFKALFDFNMSDTFNYMSRGRQIYNEYGRDVVNLAADFLRGYLGKGKPSPRRTGTSIVKHGPQGTTYTEKSFTYSE